MSLTGKDGMLRVIDLETHKPPYQVPFTTRLNSEGPVGLYNQVAPELGGANPTITLFALE